MRRRLTLTRQLVALQLLIVLGVLAGVAAISLAQSAQSFQRTEGRRALSAAESLGANPTVRDQLPDASTPDGRAALPSVAEAVRTVSGASSVVLAAAGADGATVLTSSDPGEVGRQLVLGDPRVLTGRAWSGLLSTGRGTQVVAQVPVLDLAGAVIGVAVVGRTYPSAWQRLGDATPNLLVYLGVASVLGVTGSLLLARRVKRQTLGLEPEEITGLVEQREAMLRGLKEGVIALDTHLRVTVVNASARELLELPADCEGRLLDELAVAAPLREVLTGAQAGSDRLVLVGEKVLTLNRRPMLSHGVVIGSVTTLRDRTELTTLESELGATRTATDTLRAHTHEFTNQLHTISGLVQLGEYDEVVRFVDGLSRSRTRLNDDVTSRVHDPGVAALLIAKASLAAERGVELQLDPASALARGDDALSLDLTTVLGNLVDNAVDAVGGSSVRTVRVHLAQPDGMVVVTVHDSGPGVAPGLVDDVFRQGFSTKAAGAGGRGFGLAITRLVCERRGGRVGVHADGGAVFTAELPVRVGARA